MAMNERMLIAVMFVFCVEGFACPNHCFCYKWKDLMKTECVGRNLYNTFLPFSHQTQVLDLSFNVLTILHGNEFLDANLRLLQHLCISNNRLHKIDKLSFNGLQFLQNLDLSNNIIEYLTPTTFIHNFQLKSLNVSHNPLRVIFDAPFLASSSLLLLDVAHCQFDHVTTRTFLQLTKLEILNVSRNSIEKIKGDVLQGMKNLKYLDVSRNNLPCNEQTAKFLEDLTSHGVRFRSFCHVSQKIIMAVTEPPQIGKHGLREYKNMSDVVQNQPNLIDDVKVFFQSIPSIYVFLCGVQVGTLVGAIVTCVCMKKSRKLSKEKAITERPVLIDSDSDHLTFALIPLNTPPGTPPSPYHSRIFTDFPLHAT